MKKKSAVSARKKAAVAAPVSEAAKSQAAGSKPSKAVAVIALLINLFIPGLGTILGGKMKHGLVQLLLLWLGGIIVTFLGFFLVIASPIAGLIVAMLGCLMILAGWVWAIISGVLILRNASS